MPGVSEAELAEVAQLSSLADETPEGRSIVVLAKRYGIREHRLHNAAREAGNMSAPRVMSSCLPTSTISMSFVGLESRSTILLGA